MKRFIIIAVLLALGPTGRATAGTVLDRVHRDNVVRCASDLGFDLASANGEQAPFLQFCRAVAIAVLGSRANVTFVNGPPMLDTDIAFVSDEAAAGRLHFVPGPAPFNDTLAILVPIASQVRVARDLAGETVCLMIGSPAQDALETLAHRLKIDITRFGFEEAVEMEDAYSVGRCGAMVGSATWLSGLRGPTGINRLSSRMLAEPLASIPIFAATDPTDTEWAEIVLQAARKLLPEPN